MASRKKARGKSATDPATQSFLNGLDVVRSHPLFRVIVPSVVRNDASLCPPNGFAIALRNGSIHVNPRIRLEPAEWAWVLAHASLHYGFGHVAANAHDEAEQIARCTVVCRFLTAIKFGQSPLLSPELPGGDELSIASMLRTRSISLTLDQVSTTGGLDILESGVLERPGTWEIRFAEGLEEAVEASLSLAAGEISDFGERPKPRSRWQHALSWFVSSYPLLGALASAFNVEEDPDICEQAGIAIAAVSPSTQTLYLRRDVVLTESERRFVVAHELLHAGLRHDTRTGGRDPWLWNVACDYVINDWLVQMGVGDLPEQVLYDPQLHGLSAESVYDQIVVDLRRHRKVRTFAGIGVPDMVPGRLADQTCGVTLDEFYRRALQQGFELWRSVGRGLVPAGLEEEIRALAHPPVPWDVKLARWFEHYVPAAQRTRSYARLSRRQSSTPDIPRPSYVRPYEPDNLRGFGVVIDTSGSMDSRLLGRALGAVASYAHAREVAFVRVVFCDAAAYDVGWLAADDIAGRVRVRGRGGTVLQPGIDLLERATDFPQTGPILVITDGECDKFRIARNHAILIPSAARLPFIPSGPVFRMPPVGVEREAAPSNRRSSQPRSRGRGNP
jgi:predicted metal-dependent peptidase